MNYKYILTTLLLFISIHLFSSPHQGYNIEVHAPFKEGSMAYLAKYWDGQSYIQDSVAVSANGIAVFSSKNKLSTGQYLLYIAPDVQMEILVDEKEGQHIKIELDKEKLFNSKVTGSKSTFLFWNYLKGYNLLIDKKDTIIRAINEAKPTDSDYDLLKKQYAESIQDIETYHQNHYKQNKKTWFATFVNAAKPIYKRPHPVPATRAELEANEKYVKEHYYDNIDLTDIRLWNTSFFIPHIRNYLKEVIDTHPDSIAKEASWLVSKAQKNEVTFKEMLSLLVNDATTSQLMRMENTWAKLAEDYIFDKNISWIDSTQYSELRKDYSLIENNRLGMTAKNLQLATINNDSINTNEVDAEFTLLYFYSPHCSYCHTELPLLKKDFYDKYKDKGIKVIAINIDGDKTSWENFVTQLGLQDFINAADPFYKSQYWMNYNVSGTPSLYLLDKNKTIIGKRLNVANLLIFFEQFIY